MDFAPIARAAVLFGTPISAIALASLPPPGILSPQAWSVALVALVMAVWWMTEIVPLAVTALIPLVAIPFLNVQSIEDVASSYAHPLIFLFFGGFVLSRAMERWGVHKRIAYFVIRAAGGGPAGIIGSLMAVTAFLSLWISNTATAMVMLPVGQAVAGSSRGVGAQGGEGSRTFGAALMLSIGYAATIGGMGSLIGTPPNALFAGFMLDLYNIEIGFAQWMLLGLPVVLVLLPITWWVLTRLSFPVSRLELHIATDSLSESSVKHAMSTAEKRVALLMLGVALSWIFRPFINRALPDFQLTDAGIAISAALLAFVLPAGRGNTGTLLSWRDVATIRWDVLILFGGGLALAKSIGASGLAEWIGQLAVAMQHVPLLLLLAMLMIIVVYLGELASNTAMAAVFLPMAGAAAVGMGDHPMSLMLPVTLAASLGFMLPVATPPNAIVYGSGAVSSGQMLRAGTWLDIIGIAVVLLIGWLLAPLVFPYT